MREDLLLRSLTTPAAHREEDYDELEYSGDVVLKCMASAYLCVLIITKTASLASPD